MHLCDNRLGQIPDPHPTVGHVAGPLAVPGRRGERQVVPFVSATQVVPGRKAGPGASDDGHPDPLVDIGGHQGVEQGTP